MVEPAEHFNVSPEGSQSRVIILIGEHGMGKSSLGNLLLNEGRRSSHEIFKTLSSPSDCTYTCELLETMYNNTKYNILDTPGLNFKYPKAENLEGIKEKIMDGMINCDKPRIDAAFIVTKCDNRENYENIKKQLKSIYGEGILKTIVVVKNAYDYFIDNTEEEMKEILQRDESEIKKTFGDCPIQYTCSKPKTLERISKESFSKPIHNQTKNLFELVEKNTISGNILGVKEIKEMRKKYFILMEEYIEGILKVGCSEDTIEPTLKIPLQLKYYITKKGYKLLAAGSGIGGFLGGAAAIVGIFELLKLVFSFFSEK